MPKTQAASPFTKTEYSKLAVKLMPKQHRGLPAATALPDDAQEIA
jgi:hypothetical protein